MLSPPGALQPPAELVSFVELHVCKAGLFDPSEKPYLQVVPVLVQPVDKQYQPLSAPAAAVTRDLSPKSVGLVHTEPIQHSLVALRLSLADEVVNLVAGIQWCMPLGPYFYSGGNFVARLEHFPVYRAAGSAQRPAASSKILVVDDSAVSALMLQFNLKSAGYQTTIAGNGQVAWMKAQEQQFDLVLTDEQLPLLSGTELCRLLRSHEVYRETPLILFTTRGELPGRSRLEQELKIVARVYKSFSPAELLATIQAALN